jgi:hypothetical protein
VASDGNLAGAGSSNDYWIVHSPVMTVGRLDTLAVLPVCEITVRLGTGSIGWDFRP